MKSNKSYKMVIKKKIYSQSEDDGDDDELVYCFLFSLPEDIRKIEEELRQLSKGTHPELIKTSRKIDTWLNEEKQKIQIDEIHKEYKKEIEACDKDCKVQDYLISLCDELKKRLEHDKKYIELTPSGDVLDLKPTITRKLRRRGTHISGNITNTFCNWGDLIVCSSLWPGGQKNAVSSNQDSGKVSGNSPTEQSLSVFEGSSINDINATNSPESKNDVAQNQQGNLFGSLGINLLDGSLTPHLMASITVNGNATISTFIREIQENPSLSSNQWSSSLAFCPGPSSSNNSLSGMMALNSYVPPTLGHNKRRKTHQNAPLVQLNLLLNENDIYSDLTTIQRACGKVSNASMNTRKQSSGGFLNPGPMTGSFNSYNGLRSSGADNKVAISDENVPQAGYKRSNAAAALDSFQSNGESYVNSSISCWIDDGWLYYKQKCFQRGAAVILEGREGSSHGCVGKIAAIGAQDISIRRSSDHGTTKVTVQQLKSGRFKLLQNNV